ncbi:MAG: glycine--tRNA ligase subunit beta, partial [Gammaproteobacteria bacterium]|nr:glycine--tRNA ligase subunit beta [Gammaproteobacteria bacterium]
MSTKQDFLFELGTEELPPKALARLAQALAEGVCQRLSEAELGFGEVESFATPRRLALVIKDLESQQADKEVLRKGPALTAAFKEDGTPTPAAQGFARSCGVSVDALEKLETAEGAWLAHNSKVAGQSTPALLPEFFEQALNRLPIPKRMRWGSNTHQFVRPVHWLVMLYGEDVVPCSMLGLNAGRVTFGHRFHHPSELHIPRPAEYAVLLESEGHVLPRFERRKLTIRAQVEEAALKLGGKAVIDEDLLDEVTALVEWPAAITGSFDARFLELPPEVLIAVMEGHQRYFHVVDDKGALLPNFITVANIVSKDPAQVSAGNERVILPRLSDAEFFWRRDCDTPLFDLVSRLNQVVFQKKLGTVLEKVNRVTRLAASIAKELGADSAKCERAAQLAKADLMTGMVGEFPELQGIMGSYYAKVSKEDESVAAAIADHYRPRFAGDEVATESTAYTVAIADKLDTVVGIFGIGQIPSGEKDPFALRRAALGIQRTLIENKLNLNLSHMIADAIKGFDKGVIQKDTAKLVYAFMMDRLRSYYADQGYRPDEFEAVLETEVSSSFDFEQRLKAVHEFRALAESASLAAANKRCRNILRKNEETVPARIDPALFEGEQEQSLAKALEQMDQTCAASLKDKDYTAALK